MAQSKGTATWFIEVWQSKSSTHQTIIMPIKYLQVQLRATKRCGSKTIAVWHITPKTKQP